MPVGGGKPADGEAGELGIAARVRRGVVALDFYLQAIRLIVATRPAIVHCNDHNTMWVGVVAKVLTGALVIYDSHELWPDRNGRWERRWWLLSSEALFVRVADRVVMSSPGHGEVLAARYRTDPPTIVRNIPERRLAASSPRSVESSQPSAVYVGGLLPNRGIEQTMNGLGHTERIGLRLLGSGGDAYVDRLKRLAEVVAPGRVEFLPAVASDEVVDSIAGGTFGVALFQPTCESHRLVLPNKVFEYLAAGLPVLVSDVPVLRALVEEHECGLVASPTDPDAIALAMNELSQPNRNRAMKSAAHAAAEEMSWERERGRLARCYDLV